MAHSRYLINDGPCTSYALNGEDADPDAPNKVPQTGQLTQQKYTFCTVAAAGSPRSSPAEPVGAPAPACRRPPPRGGTYVTERSSNRDTQWTGSGPTGIEHHQFPGGRISRCSAPEGPGSTGAFPRGPSAHPSPAVASPHSARSNFHSLASGIGPLHHLSCW